MTDVIKIVEEEQIKLTIYVPKLVLGQVCFHSFVNECMQCSIDV